MGKKTMTSRERVERAVRLQEPDRVPRDIWITQDAYVALRRELGARRVKDRCQPR